MDSTHYEEDRYKILVFFMEKLKDKSRSVIQLTSFFGSKDFTQSMRSVVGAKLAGVRKFLSSYPTIFHIENGIVTLKETFPETIPKPICHINKEKYDAQEAKEFFKNKLLILKGGKSMPILSLHGHRGQAPFNVRKESGKTVVDLQKFLCKYPETFTVIGTEVSLAQTDDLKMYAEKRSKSENGEKFNESVTKKLKQLTKVFPLAIKNSTERIEKEEKKDSCAQMKNKIHFLLPSSLKEKKKNKETDCNLQRGFALHFEGNSWKSWKKSLITNVEDCNFITQAILKSAANDQVVVSLSCEGGCCNAKYQLTLLQIATTRGEALIFDIMTCPEMMTEGGLKNILEFKNIIKIIHNCSMISAHLHRDFGVLLSNVLDTQSAHAVLQLQKYQIPVSEVRKVQINQLCAIFGAPVNPLQVHLKKVLLRDEHYWTRRPLSPGMLCYAVGDVLTLVNEQLLMGISDILPEYHDLLSELCTDQILRYIFPKEVNTREEKRRTCSEVVNLPELIDKRIISSNPDVSLLQHIDLTEEKQERSERLKETYMIENNSDQDDFESKFEETSKLLDKIQTYDDVIVESLCSSSSESPDYTDVSNLIDSINVDIFSGIMDELFEFNDLPSAEASGQISTTLSGIDPDVEAREATPNIPLIDLTVEEKPPKDFPKKKIEILSIECLQNLNISMIQNNENNSAEPKDYDSVVVRSITDEKKNVRKRSGTEVIWQNEEAPPEKLFCREPDIISPAFSVDDTDETTSGDLSNEPPSPPRGYYWEL